MFFLGANISNSRAVSSLLFFFGGIIWAVPRCLRKSCKHCWWDRIYAPTYVSWSIPPMHPKRPQMKGIPSVGACSRDMLENSFLYESWGSFSHVYPTWGERSYPTCWNGPLGYIHVSAARRLAVSNPEKDHVSCNALGCLPIGIHGTGICTHGFTYIYLFWNQM